MAHDDVGTPLLSRCRAEFEQAAAACFAAADEPGENAFRQMRQAGNAAENYRQALFAARETRGAEFHQAAQDLAAQVQFLMRAIFVIRKQALRHRRLV